MRILRIGAGGSAWSTRVPPRAQRSCRGPTRSRLSCFRGKAKARSGKTRTLSLSATEPGVWRSTVEVGELGLWHATDGTLNALANVGPPNPREFTEVTSTSEVLAPLARSTGGSAVRVEDAGGA